MAIKIAVFFTYLAIVLTSTLAKGSDDKGSGMSSITNFNPINNIPNFPGSGSGSSGGLPGLQNLSGNQEAFQSFMTLASDPCTWKTMSSFMKLMAEANKGQQKKN